MRWRSRRSSRSRRRRCAVGLVERDEGLVQEEERGLDDEGAGKGGAAGHAEREARGEDLGSTLEPDLGQDAEDAGAGLGCLGQDQGQVLGHRAPGEETRLLEDVGEPRVGPALDAAGEAAVEAGDQVEERGLAAARGADDGHGLAGRDLQPDAVQHLAHRCPAERGEGLGLDVDGQRRHRASAALERLDQAPFDHLDDGDEGDAVGQDRGDVEELEVDARAGSRPHSSGRAARPRARSSRSGRGRSGRRPADRGRAGAG